MSLGNLGRSLWDRPVKFHRLPRKSLRETSVQLLRGKEGAAASHQEGKPEPRAPNSGDRCALELAGVSRQAIDKARGAREASARKGQEGYSDLVFAVSLR